MIYLLPLLDDREEDPLELLELLVLRELPELYDRLFDLEVLKLLFEDLVCRD